MAGFWQVSLLVYGLKFDLVDVVLPFRYHFSESIKAGIFPFWNPYIQTGTPFYADLQVPFYYPELLIVSLLGGYSVITMHLLFVLYVSVAAIGMYRLSHYFHNHHHAALMAGLAYAFSGFIVGHGQHFFLLVGAAWIPWVILYYIRMCRERDHLLIIKAGLLIFLMVTGAYQALSITLLYLLTVLFCLFLVQSLQKSDKKVWIRLIFRNLILGMLVVALCSPLIASVLEIRGQVARLGEGVSLEKTLLYVQPLTSLLSFVAPSSTLTRPQFFGNVDISMINHFIGIIPLLFLVPALVRKRSALEYVILAFGLLIFASAFSVPLRTFMYRYVPMMNLFLYPAFIRVFGLLALILVASGGMTRLDTLQGVKDHRRYLLPAAMVMWLVFVVLALASLVRPGGWQPDMIVSGSFVRDVLTHPSFYRKILLHSVFHGMVVFIFVWIWFFRKKTGNRLQWVFVLAVVELLSAAWFNMNATVTDREHNPFGMQNDLALCPEGFPVPYDVPIAFNNEQHPFFTPFWRNTTVFTKRVSVHAFSSFQLNTFSRFDDQHPTLKQAVLQNRLFYFSDTLVRESSFSDTAVGPEDHNILVVSDADYQTLKHQIFKTDTADRIVITELSPNRAEAVTHTTQKQLLAMLQTRYPGWKAYIDGKEVPSFTSNFNYRTIVLPAGKHTLRWEYRNSLILGLYIFSNLLFLLLILYVFWQGWKNRAPNRLLRIGVPVLLVVLPGFLLVRVLVANPGSATIHDWNHEKWPSVSESSKSAGNISQKFDIECHTDTQNIDSEDEYIPIATLRPKEDRAVSGTLVVRFEVFTDTLIHTLVVSDIQPAEGAPQAWHADMMELQIERINRWNEVIYTRNFFKIKPGESVRVFIWNHNRGRFQVRGVRVGSLKLGVRS